LEERWDTLSLAREYPRIELRLPVLYELENQMEKNIIITDFSPFGVRVESDHSLKEIIIFNLPQFPMKIKGRMRWEKVVNDRWFTGYQFVGIDSKVVEKLKQYVRYEHFNSSNEPSGYQEF